MYPNKLFLLFCFQGPVSTTSGIAVTNIRESEFTVSWIDAYDSEFLTQQTLIITSLGPNHFVPINCDIERNQVYRINIQPGEDTHVFSNGFANFDYSVQLLTTYTLGSSHESETVTTRTVTGSKYLLFFVVQFVTYLHLRTWSANRVDRCVGLYTWNS